MSDCIEWTGALSRKGYGMTTRGQQAHRQAFREATGIEPGKLFVCHSCDNRKCVNPAHLWLGTHADNMRDRNTKGRQARLVGELSGLAVLKEHQVKSIIEDPRKYPLIAKDYGISTSHVSTIKAGKCWPHLDRSNVIFSRAQAKMTPEKVREIRAACGTHKEIGAMFGISPATVGQIRSRKTFRYVD